MNLKDQISKDLKTALLSGDKGLVFVLRGLKSVILNEEVAQGKRDTGLEDRTIVSLLQKEVKKRNEAIELYEKAGESQRAAQEKYEAEVIDKYLPEMMSEEEITSVVESVVSELDERNMSKMGQVIAEVKKRTDGRADGAVIARITKEKLR